MTQAPPPPAPLTEMRLTDEIKQSVNNALASGKPMIIAYVDPEGQPSLSFRGSTHVHSDNQLAVWVRNPEGGLLKGLQGNPKVTLMYRDPETRTTLQFRGTARIDESEQMRDTVYNASPEPERNADKEKKGKAMVIDLERVDGILPGARVQMRR